MIRVLKTIDAHVGGQPLRLVVDGMPRPHGRTSTQQREWCLTHADAFRRAIVLAPRGHTDMTAALLTEPSSVHANTGIVFMDAAGYPSMSGHGIIAAATIALERRLTLTRAPASDDERLVFDTPAGTVQARARIETRAGLRSVDSVAVTNVPAFVHAAGRQCVRRTPRAARGRRLRRRVLCDRGQRGDGSAARFNPPP